MHTPTTTELCDDMLKLEYLHREIFILKNPEYSRYEFQDKLREVTIKSSALIKDDTRNLLIAAYWFKLFERTVFKTHAPSSYFNDIEDVTHFIMYKDLTHLISKNIEQAQALACLCLVRVNLVSQGYAHQKRQPVKSIMEKWSGGKVSDETISSMEKTVEFFYGPACWGLCHDEVTPLTKLPNYLRTQNVPLTERLYQNELMPTELPFDL